MNTLRWILGTLGFVLGGGILLLSVQASALCKMFGTSGNGPLFLGALTVGWGLLLAAIFLPSSKPLLHLAAVAAVGLVGLCLREIFKNGDAPLWFAVAYFVAWFVFYWLAAWHTSPQP